MGHATAPEQPATPVERSCDRARAIGDPGVAISDLSHEVSNPSGAVH
jgi:hypothetical protein